MRHEVICVCLCVVVVSKVIDAEREDGGLGVVFPEAVLVLWGRMLQTKLVYEILRTVGIFLFRMKKRVPVTRSTGGRLRPTPNCSSRHHSSAMERSHVVVSGPRNRESRAPARPTIGGWRCDCECGVVVGTISD